MLKMLTSEQTWSLVRTAIQSAGASLAVLGVVHPETVEEVLGITAATQVLVGAAANFATTVYSVWIRRKVGLVATAAAVVAPSGGRIITTPEIAAKVSDPAVITR